MTGIIQAKSDENVQVLQRKLHRKKVYFCVFETPSSRPKKRSRERYTLVENDGKNQMKEKTAKKCSQLRGEMSEIIYTRPSLSAEV